MTSTFRDPAKVLRDIIINEMGLTAQQVEVYNQKYDIPTVPGIYVAISFVSGRCIGAKSYVEDAGVDDHDVDLGLTEIQEVAMNELYQIDIMSADLTARARKEELILAMTSIFAQQQCEKYQMNIASIPQNFMDASDVEGSARLTRYTMTIAVNALYKKIKAAPYYDQYPSPEIWVDTKPEA